MSIYYSFLWFNTIVLCGYSLIARSLPYANRETMWPSTGRKKPTAYVQGGKRMPPPWRSSRCSAGWRSVRLTMPYMKLLQRVHLFYLILLVLHGTSFASFAVHFWSFVHLWMDGRWWRISVAYCFCYLNAPSCCSFAATSRCLYLPLPCCVLLQYLLPRNLRGLPVVWLPYSSRSPTYRLRCADILPLSSFCITHTSLLQRYAASDAWFNAQPTSWPSPTSYSARDQCLFFSFAPSLAIFSYALPSACLRRVHSLPYHRAAAACRVCPCRETLCRGFTIYSSWFLPPNRW